jgi:hypothetical protein
MTNDEPSALRKYIADSLEKERQPAAEIKPRKASRRTVDPKIFITDVLVNGPVPTNTVLQRGAERGLTKKQIWYARERLKIVAFKELGKNGCWFLALPNHER